MARIDIKSAGATLSDGVLQLENGVAMDTTLRNVADQNNTTSPLKLSTTGVQVASTLRITTDSNPYIDAEDGSTNNRFTVGRDPASQQVNVDFASNPAGSTTTVGAIRTFTNGVALGEVVKFREDGQVTFTERVNVEADSLVTTQSSSVIAADTANASLVIAPNGTGALIADIPDGTATGGNVRGSYAVDLQMIRTAATQVARETSSGILSGANNTVNSSAVESVIGGGSGNQVTNTRSAVLGGFSNHAAFPYSTVVGGQSNTANSFHSFIGGGQSNNISSGNWSTVSGGQSNTASSGTHATVVGGQSNTSSGQQSVSGGNSNVASGFRSVALGGGSTVSGDRATSVGGSGNTVSGSLSGMLCGEDSTCAGSNNLCVGGKQTTVGNGTANSLVGGRSNGINNGVDYSFLGGGQSNIISGASGGADWSSIIGGFSNTATGLYSTVLGTKEANSFLYGSVASSSGMFSSVADAQQTSLTARREATLTTGGTTTLSLDGTGTTNLIIPDGNNRMWNVQVRWVAVVTAITGTATGVTVGDTKTSTDLLAVAKRGGVTTVSAHTSAGTHAIETIAGSLTAANIAYTAGASQQMAITFTGPTFAGGGSVTMRVVAAISLTEVAYV